MLLGAEQAASIAMASMVRSINKLGTVRLIIRKEDLIAALFNAVSTTLTSVSERIAENVVMTGILDKVYSDYLELGTSTVLTLEEKMDSVEPLLRVVISDVVEKEIKNSRIEKVIYEYIVLSYNEGGKVALNSIWTALKGLEKKSVEGELEIDFDIKDPAVLNALMIRANTIKGITDSDFKDKVIKTIIDGLFYDKLGPREIALRLKEVIPQFSKERALLIARTEVQIAQNRAIVDSGRKNGIAWKEWITVGDRKVREDHALNESEGEIPFEGVFGGTGDFSPDQCHSPWNCRCSLALVMKADDPLPQSLWDGEQQVQIDF